MYHYVNPDTFRIEKTKIFIFITYLCRLRLSQTSQCVVFLVNMSKKKKKSFLSNKLLTHKKCCFELLMMLLLLVKYNVFWTLTIVPQLKTIKGY